MNGKLGRVAVETADGAYSVLTEHVVAAAFDNFAFVSVAIQALALTRAVAAVRFPHHGPIAPGMVKKPYVFMYQVVADDTENYRRNDDKN